MMLYRSTIYRTGFKVAFRSADARKDPNLQVAAETFGDQIPWLELQIISERTRSSASNT